MNKHISFTALAVWACILSAGCKSREQYELEKQASAQHHEWSMKATQSLLSGPGPSPAMAQHALVGKWIGSHQGGTDNLAATISANGNLRVILMLPPADGATSATTKRDALVHVVRGTWTTIDADGIKVAYDDDATTQPAYRSENRVELIGPDEAVFTSATESIRVRRAK